MADWIGVDMAESTRACSIDECELPHYGRSWCRPHYMRWRRHGDPLGSRTRKTRCAVAGCERPWRARDWCFMHYQRWLRHGDLDHGRSRQKCTVSGCEEYRVSRGWCSKHLTRWNRYGSPTHRVPGEVVNGHRICSACRTDKPVEEFPYGRAGRCQECTKRYHASEERRAARAAWKVANAELVRSYARIRAHARRLKIATTEVDRITPARLAARMSYFGNRCWMCGGAFEHIDHVKPLSKGGPHILANLRPSCAKCNMLKSDTWGGPADAMALAA